MSDQFQVDIQTVTLLLKQFHPYSELGIEGTYARLMEFDKEYLFEIFEQILLTNEKMRKITASAILHIDDQEGISLILPLLEDKNCDIRIHICGLLSQIGDERAISPLVLRLNDEDPNVRYTAVYTLGKIGNEKVIPILQNVKQNDTGTDYEGRSICDEASEAIANILSRK